MTSEFDHVRSAFWSSLPARLMIGIGNIARSAWRSSFFGETVNNISSGVRALPPAARLRMAAIAIAIAALLQPLLMWMMPETVRPAMPIAVFIGVVMIAAFAAWQAEPLARLLAPDRPASNVG